MIHDDMTIYIHEIYMLNRFLMVPCFENHQFDEFLMFYLKKTEISDKNTRNVIIKKRTNTKHLFVDPMFKITQKTTNDAQH